MHTVTHILNKETSSLALHIIHLSFTNSSQKLNPPLSSEMSPGTSHPCCKDSISHGLRLPFIAMTRKAKDGFHTGEGEGKERQKTRAQSMCWHIKSQALYQLSGENAGIEITC